MTQAALISSLQRRLAVKLDVLCLMHLAADDITYIYIWLTSEEGGFN